MRRRARGENERAPVAALRTAADACVGAESETSPRLLADATRFRLPAPPPGTPRAAGYTVISSKLKPVQVMALLDSLYSAFDHLAQEAGLFKARS